MKCDDVWWSSSPPWMHKGTREQNCQFKDFSLSAGIVTPISITTTRARSTSSQMRDNPLLQINWSRSMVTRYPCNLHIDCSTSTSKMIWVNLLTRWLWDPCVWCWRNEYTSSCRLGRNWSVHVHLWCMRIRSLWSQSNSCLEHMSRILKTTCTIVLQSSEELICLCCWCQDTRKQVKHFHVENSNCVSCKLYSMHD